MKPPLTGRIALDYRAHNAEVKPVWDTCRAVKLPRLPAHVKYRYL